MAHVTASFAVGAGAYGEEEMDLSGLTPNEMADRIAVIDVDISLCHQCARHLSDPEVDELTGFTVDGVDYERRDGHWVES